MLLLCCYHLLLQQLHQAASEPQPEQRRRLFRASQAAKATASTSANSGCDSSPPPESRALPDWRPPAGSNLKVNPPAARLLAPTDPARTTIFFTFGSYSMMSFLRNWRHFALKLGLGPAVVGAADSGMLSACTSERIPAFGIVEGLDVWTYTRSSNASTVVQEGKSDWKYYRHHKSSFLELGLVKVAFLWEIISLEYDVLISDLDVVWLAPQWQRWMTYKHAETPPLPEASLQAMSDVLVSTDELDEAYDGHGAWERWPFGVGWGRRADLNTGVLFFRATNGSKAFLQAWRLAMLAKREVENTNDQFVFCDMVRNAKMEPVTERAEHMDAWRASLRAHGLDRPAAFQSLGPNTRGVVISTASVAPPCLPHAGCAAARFTLGTLPLRAFTGGHTYFMQRVQNFEGHALPRASVLTVHFTFQYSDTPDFPHGKRQRAREAGLWTADPPEYYSEGRYLRLVGPLYSAAQRVDAFKRFPEWSPQRHMAIDALQRAAVRDGLALATALNATLIMPPLVCTCDRYWGFTQNCRMPTAPREQPLPFRCSQDALFEVKRWNDKGVRFREANFLDDPRTDPAIAAAALRLVVHPSAPAPAPRSPESRFTAVLRPGSPMSDVAAAVDAANPNARLVDVGAADLRRLCKWLGSTAANRAFNQVARYVLTESARYCPEEDHDAVVANVPHWNWRNPFTAYNCTWGFHAPTDYPEPASGAPPCAAGEAGVALRERTNSTTCPRAMLCDHNTQKGAGEVTGRISRCNVEWYAGLDYKSYGDATKRALAEMPEGRCPYPPGDVPGQGLPAGQRWKHRSEVGDAACPGDPACPDANRFRYE